MEKKLGHVRIKAPHFVAGIAWVKTPQGVKNKVAPIIKYMSTWTPIKIREYCEHKGWECATHFSTTEAYRRGNVAKKQTQEPSTQQVIQKEALVEVTQTILGQPTTIVKKRIKIRPFVTTPATVGVKYGTTLRVGQSNHYEFIKLDVFIRAPAYVEEMVSVFNQCCALGDKLMARETDKILKAKER